MHEFSQFWRQSGGSGCQWLAVVARHYRQNLAAGGKTLVSLSKLEKLAVRIKMLKCRRLPREFSSCYGKTWRFPSLKMASGPGWNWTSFCVAFPRQTKRKQLNCGLQAASSRLGEETDIYRRPRDILDPSSVVALLALLNVLLDKY